MVRVISIKSSAYSKALRFEVLLNEIDPWYVFSAFLDDFVYTYDKSDERLHPYLTPL